jgi:hypothetical protein
MDSTSRKVSWACLCGGIIAMAIYTVANDILWSLSGFVAGGLAAYILVDLRGFVSGVKAAWHETRKEIRRDTVVRANLRAKLRNWQLEYADVNGALKRVRCARLTAVLVYLASLTALLVALCVLGATMRGAGDVHAYGRLFDVGTLIILLHFTVSVYMFAKAAGPLMVLKVVPGEPTYYTRPSKYTDWSDDESRLGAVKTASLRVDSDAVVATYAKASRAFWSFCLRGNIVAFVAFWPLYWLYRAAAASPKWMPATLRSVGTFCVTLIRLVHSQLRVTCAVWVIVGTALTAGLLVEPGMTPVGKLFLVALNGALCAFLGAVDYRLVQHFKPHWLPANGTA